ncbi:uroporphyrinogen-III synthase [Taibaiella chishuiensis]|uniref:Uroporphyrinogen-III synthase n=1 Tax=Taibaiella chishuiensis TaxID=1434707 RepID=A0A2P8CXK9_9BACT|nr:uroporphyrinogen-III synthase [Taibaiella chishuiensis]PSK89715.1 uroporphyrinogen-III synthase [Taibaiella chishuiensis]
MDINLLSTRHLSAESIKDAAWCGIHIDITPFIEVAIREDEALLQSLLPLAGKPILAIFTSAYAVQALQELMPEAPRTWNIACTGGKTAQEAADWLGDAAIVATAPNAAQLAQKITALSAQQVVFFCGDQRLDHLPVALQRSGIPLEEIIVYETKATPLVLDTQPYRGVLFFSPSAVHSFFSVNMLPFKCTVFAIGATTAAVVQSYTFHNTVISPEPGEQAMLDQVINYYNEERLIN